MRLFGGPTLSSLLTSATVSVHRDSSPAPGLAPRTGSVRSHPTSPNPRRNLRWSWSGPYASPAERDNMKTFQSGRADVSLCFVFQPQKHKPWFYILSLRSVKNYKKNEKKWKVEEELTYHPFHFHMKEYIERKGGKLMNMSGLSLHIHWLQI